MKKEVNQMDIEQVVLKLITYSGNARSLCLSAIRTVREGDATKGQQLIDEANGALIEAHGYQTKLIQQEVRGEKTDISLLLIHAQDHLMNALTVRDLAIEIIENNKQLKELI